MKVQVPYPKPSLTLSPGHLGPKQQVYQNLLWLWEYCMESITYYIIPGPKNKMLLLRLSLKSTLV